jgi:pilus assembly protein CpaB
MATRFGAVSPAQTYATKVKWLVGCLVSVIFVLAVAIIFIAQNTDAVEKPPAPVPETKFTQDVAPTIDVLVASIRIEEGKRITTEMLTPVAMDADKTPMAVVRAQDQERIIGKFAKRMINANMPIVLEDLGDNPPVDQLKIPPGYRAASIQLNSRTGVDGFAKPNSRVDILWSYSQRGKKRVATIARFVKVLSVAGLTNVDQKRTNIKKKVTVTLLVTEKDAKKIELARTLGSLTLSLVGEQETSTKTGEPDTIDITDLIGRPKAENEEVSNDGVMYTSDPRTGRQLRYVLRNGRWALDRSFAGGE